jgi:hypothetical protein
MTQQKSNEQSLENAEEEIEHAAGEVRQEIGTKEAQTQRLARAIRTILTARETRRRPSPDGVGREDVNQEQPDTEPSSVEWAMRLML